MHTHTHIYVYYTYTCIHMCIIYLYDIHTIAYKHMYIHTYVHTHIYMHTHMYTHMYAHMHAQMYTDMCKYIYIDVDMEIDMHGLKLADSWWCFLRCGTFWRTVRTYHSQYTVGYKFSFGKSMIIDPDPWTRTCLANLVECLDQGWWRMLEHDIGYRNHTGCEGWHASKILVGGLEHLLFFHRLGMSSSQLTKLYFSEGWLNHQPDGMWLTHFMTGSQEAGGPGMEHTVGKWVDVGYSVIELALIYWPVPVWQYWPYKPH